MSSSAELATSSEATMLEKRLEDELKSMVQDMINGDAGDMEAKKAHEALFLAAKEICYKRKYYDASKDEIVYFPTLAKTIMDHSLMEKADDFYEDGEDEEFPRDYSMRLRKIAYSRMAETGESTNHGDSDSEQEELDHKIMMSVSQPVAVVVTTNGSTSDPKKTNTQQTLIWKRGSVADGKDAEISFPVEIDTYVENDDEPTANHHSISELQIQKNLGLRRQASFLRKASIMDSLEKYYEPEPMKKSTKVVANKEVEMRQTRIIKELKTMIEQMLQLRDFEDETDMEPQAQQALVKAAKDICYTRKHYDASDDEMIYFPSLVKTIYNNSLFEKAEEYYSVDNDEEFPEEYVMGLRRVAFAQMEEEEDGMHRVDDGDAEEDEMEYSMRFQLSQPVGLTVPSASPIKKKSKMPPKMVLKDKRMDESEDTMVWTRSTRNLHPETPVEVAMEVEASMAASLAALPEQHPAIPTSVQKPAEGAAKRSSTVTTEADVRQKLEMRRQASFLRKAAVLDSIGKHEGEENLPSIGEKKKTKVQPSTLKDKRMDTSEEAFVWTRSDQNLGADARISFEVATATEPQTLPDKKEAAAKKPQTVTEDDVQQRLGMRRQQSFLRKAAVLDSIGKHEGDLPPIGEVSDSIRGSTKKILGNTPREKCIEAEINAFVRKAGEDHLDDPMRNEAIKALKISTDKYAYKKKFYDAEKDTFIVFPSVARCMFDNDTYALAEVHYYGKEDKFPLKYIEAMRNVGTEAGGAEEDVEYMLIMGVDCDSTDDLFSTKLASLAVPEETDKKKKKKTTARASILMDKRMDASEEALVWTRSGQNLGAEGTLSFQATTIEEKQRLPPTAEAAAKKPTTATEDDVQQRLVMRRQQSFLRKAAVMASIGKLEGEDDLLPSIGESSDFDQILGNSPREKCIEAEINAFVRKAGEKHLNEPMKSMAIKGLKLGANKYAYKKKFYDAESDKFIVFPSVAWCMIDSSIFEEAEKLYYKVEGGFPKKYREAMRSVGVEEGGAEEAVEYMLPLGMDCNSGDAFFATRRADVTVPEETGTKKKKKATASTSTLMDKRMDASEEAFVWTRSGRNLGAEGTLSFEATTVEEKQRLPPTAETAAKKPTTATEDDVQQRLVMRRQQSFLRKAAVMASIGKLEGEDDLLPSIGESSDFEKILGDSPREKCIEAEINAFVRKAGEEHLNGPMKSMAIKGLKLGANKYAYKKKFYDAESDKFIVFPSVAWCMIDSSIFEEAEKLYYKVEGGFPKKYREAMRSVGVEEGGAEEAVEYMLPLGMDCNSGDAFFATRRADVTLPEEGTKKKKKKATASTSTLMDKRMDASEEAFVWTRSGRNLGADTGVSFDTAPVPEQQTLATKKEVPGVSEDDVQQRLGMRRQQSFLRKAAVLDSIGKLESEDDLLPSIGESSDSDFEKILGDSPREKCIEAEINAFVRKAGEEHLNGPMKSMAIKGLKLGANKYAYKKKFYDAESDKFIVFPSVAWCMIDSSIFEEAEKLYYKVEGGFPKKYREAMRNVGVEAGGAEEEVEYMLPLGMDCNSGDAFFATRRADVTLPEEGGTKKKKKKSIASKSALMDKRMANSEEAFVWTRTDQNLGADTRLSFDTAPAPEQQTLTVKKEAATATEDDVQQRLGMRRQQSFLRKAAVLNAIGKHEDDENLPTIGESSDFDQILGNSPREKCIEAEINVFVRKAGEEHLNEPMKSMAIKGLKLGANKFAYTKKFYDAESDKFIVFPSVAWCMIDSSIYEEAEKLYYKVEGGFPKKYRDAMRSVGVEAGGAEEDVEYMFPLGMDCNSGDGFFATRRANIALLEEDGAKKKKKKPIAAASALVDKRMAASEEAFVWTRSGRNLGAEATLSFDTAPVPEQETLAVKKEAPAASQDDARQSMGMRRQQSFLRKAAVLDSIGKLESEDDLLPSIGESSDFDQILGNTPREKCIEAEINVFVRKAGEEHLNEPMRNMAIKGLKLGASKYAYKKKFYDAESDKFVVFPSVAWCMIDSSIFEEAEKLYYKVEGGFPKKYREALRSVGIEAGGAEEEVEYMLPLAVDCNSGDGFFATRRADVAVPEEGGTKKKKKKTSESGKLATQGRTSILIDNRMETSEENFVWTR